MWKKPFFGIVLGALLSLGCPPSSEVKTSGPAFNAASLPADPEGLIRIADEQQEAGQTKNAIVALERALAQVEFANSKPGYEAQWRLARAYSDLSEPDGDQRATTVPPGMTAARKAVELLPDRVEGHYYLAQLIGFSALLQKGETKQIILQMVSEGEQAARIDEKFDHGGPVRMLGALYARAPKEPVSIGDPEKAVSHMKRAVAADGDFPLNHVYLAEAYIADERYPEAASELATARKLLDNSRWQTQRDLWKAQLTRVERKLRAKQA
jgi:tetratricopeptide (TPR) repeat protein